MIGRADDVELPQTVGHRLLGARPLGDAEFVTFRVLHHRPRDVGLAVGLALGGAEGLEAGDLGDPILGVEVEVLAVLGGLAFRDLDEEPAEGVLGRGEHDEVGSRGLDEGAIGGGGPEGGQLRRVGGVEGDVGQAHERSSGTGRTMRRGDMIPDAEVRLTGRPAPC